MEDNTEITTKERILADFKRLLQQEWNIPSYADMLSVGHTRDAIRHHYGNISKLSQIAREDGDANVVYISELGKSKSVAESTKKTFIITTAVANASVHVDFMKAMETYCEARDAEIVVMLCESKTNSFQNESAIFDPILSTSPNISIVKTDTPLNINLFLCSIQVSANQIRPITGLSRIGAREGSYIFAAPKQFLEYTPTANTGKNYTIMTTGACTTPKYFDVKSFVSKRLAYIADYDHTMGAIVVEIVDEDKFHFRQIQMSGDGSFVDLGTRYNPDGTIEENIETTLILGDIHGVSVDQGNLQDFINDFGDFNIERVVLHDTFDGLSISHHIKEPGEKAGRNLTSLEEEVDVTFGVIQYINNSFTPTEGVTVVKSNHDEVIDRWIKEGRYLNEPENYRIGHHLAIVKYDDQEDMLKAAMRYCYKDPDISFDDAISPFDFVQRDEPRKVYGVEIGAHGDLGSNGSRCSMAQAEKIYGNCVIGHAHSAAIERGVFRVGTFSELRLNYNRGPSSWTHTACLLYPDGSRQLVNNIEGSFYR